MKMKLTTTERMAGFITVLVLMKYKEISIGLLGWSHDLPKHDLWIGSD